MTDFNTPPTKDEIQYARDVIQGKRKWDARIIIGFAIFGALFGILVGFSSAQANNESLDIGFTLLCSGICAATLAIVSMLVLNSIRSIGALCKVWLPARILVGIACLLLVSRIVQKIAFWVFFPSEFIADVVLSVLFLIFYILLFNIGLRIFFALYCLITGKDEDEIMTRAIAAKTNKKK